jgi:cytochrome c5
VEEQSDNTFIKNISMVLGLLIVVTIGIVFLARDTGHKEDSGNQPNRLALTEQNIKPVADVYTSEADVAAAGEAASAPVQAATTEQATAAVAEIDGESLYTTACSACHSTGAAGAPKPGSPEMALRVEKGEDALVQSALNGLNAMPPKGGRPDLSDEQIRAIVQYMTQ